MWCYGAHCLSSCGQTLCNEPKPWTDVPLKIGRSRYVCRVPSRALPHASHLLCGGTWPRPLTPGRVSTQLVRAAVSGAEAEERVRSRIDAALHERCVGAVALHAAIWHVVLLMRVLFPAACGCEYEQTPQQCPRVGSLGSGRWTTILFVALGVARAVSCFV